MPWLNNGAHHHCSRGLTDSVSPISIGDYDFMTVVADPDNLQSAKGQQTNMGGNELEGALQRWWSRIFPNILIYFARRNRYGMYTHGMESAGRDEC